MRTGEVAQTRTVRVQEALRTAILEGRLEPGARLRAAALAAQRIDEAGLTRAGNGDLAEAVMRMHVQSARAFLAEVMAGER